MQAFLGELVFGRDEKRAPLKTPAWEATETQGQLVGTIEWSLEKVYYKIVYVLVFFVIVAMYQRQRDQESVGNQS